MTTIDQEREMLLALARKWFPYPTPNPGQLEVCVEAVRMFRLGRKHVIAQAPTGIGKSAISYTVHKMMKELFDKHRTTIITASKGLQDQILNEFKDVFDLKGKTNYSCPHDKGPYNSGACRAHVGRKACSPKYECPYVQRRIQWCNKADLRMTNNSFQIEACTSLCMKDENKATLIIADECHELDDAIVDHTTIRLRANEYQMLTKFGYGGFVKDMENYINSFKSVRIGEPFSVTREMMEGMAIMHDKVEELIDTFEDMMKDTNRRDHDQVGEALEQLQQIGDKTEIFDSVNGGEWMIDEYDTGYVSIKPVYAWQVSNYALFRKAQHFLHLSATICGVEEYAGSLGIVEGEYEFFDIPNPIPVANRKVYVLGQQRISGAFDIKKLANHVDKLIQLHAPANGIIHTVSYALANQIYLNSTKRKQMLVSKERHEIMNELKQHNSGRVILSASIEKGYDFKDDMSRFQIIAKVPFLYLGDPLVKLNVERRPRWYARKAILRIVQASGRSIRGVNDHAKTYILDSNFTRLLRENMDMFPDWYLESLVIPE